MTRYCMVQVRQEITYNARRISGHASLAIWGGGNEVQGCLFPLTFVFYYMHAT